MKTRDRILKTSLELFNQEGESHVTAVDIANAMEISPGNLHYHFPGKDLIIEELFNEFEEEIRMVLNAPIQKPLDVEDNWLFFYVIFEEIFDFRFFYQNIPDFLGRSETIRVRFKRILELKEKTVWSVLETLQEKGMLVLREDQLYPLTNQIVLCLTYWIEYEAIQNEETPPKMLIHKAVYQIMSLVGAYAKYPELSLGLMSDFYKGITAGKP